MKSKKLISVFAVLTAVCIFIPTAFGACSSGGSSSEGSGTTPPDIPGGGEFVNPGDNLGGGGTGELPTETDPISVEGLTFSDLTEVSSDTDETGATVVSGSNELYTITTAGSYVLTGEFNGGVSVSVGKNEETHIFLKNAGIKNTDGIAFYNENKKSSLIITALNGTENVIENGGTDVNALHVKGDLTINGGGKLTVKSESKSAIKVSKTLTVTDADLIVEAVTHGISARNVEIQNAKVTVIAAGKDGINAECDDDTTVFPENYSEGYVKLKNVEYSAKVYGDGIQADTLIYIDCGDYDIVTTGVFVKYSAENMATYDLTSDKFRYKLSGGYYQKVASDTNIGLNSLYALLQSAKGLKVGEIKYEDASGEEITVEDGDYLIYIKSGNFDINTADDTIHANSGDAHIAGGTFTINTLDDGITSDKLTLIEGGNITIESSYEGIEGGYVEISGGTVNIISSDDGINAASDDESVKEYILISGGEITVDASGDGIDSNGSVLMTGGTVTVYGPTSGGDGALDSETGIIVQGGTLFACSSLGMVETPATNSTAYVLSYAQNSAVTAGTTITVKDSSGNKIYSVTVKKNCQSIIFSLPEFENGGTYSLYDGETELTTFTISSIITSVGSNGGMGGQGGSGGQGGQPGRPGGNR